METAVSTQSWRCDVRELLLEQVEYRELLTRIIVRDLLLRYKQTIMGFGWAVFMPLVNTAVFSVIFTRVAPMNTGAPYPLFAYCGLLTWNFFACGLRFSVTSLTGNHTLVTKVYFPREIFPFSSVLVALVDCMVGSTVLVGLLIYYRVGLSPALLFLPVVIAIQFAFTAGVALLLSMANLFFRDVKYLFEVVLTVWMFATSVLYPIDRVGGRLGALLYLNPMTPIIEGYRSVLLYGHLPPAASFAAASFVAMSVFFGGWFLFHRAEYRFAEYI